METSFVDGRVGAARKQLTLAQGQLDAAIEAGRSGSPNADMLDGASTNLMAARASIDEIGSQIEADAAALELRDCPACGKGIRTAATLCGYCWTKV
jgi:hypothetical protein